MKLSLPKIRYSLYYPAIMSILLLVGITTSFYVYIKVSGSEKRNLLRRSETLAQALNSDWIISLAGDETDLTNPQYILLKEKLFAIKQVNPDLRFVYLTGRKDGQIFFIVDSEDPQSDSYSPPGQIYPEASADFIAIFDTKKSFLEGPLADRWGSWISALSPIIDKKTGEMIASVGVDIAAEDYSRTVWLYSAFPLLITLFLLVLVMVGWIIGKKEEKIMEIKSEFVSIASHDIRSPLTGIMWMLESFSAGAKDNFTEPQKKNMKNIKISCENLLGKLNDLLLLSPLETKGIRKLDFKKGNIIIMLQEAINDLVAFAEKKSVKLVIGPNFPQEVIVKCDPDKIKRVFSNLIDNAIKYSPVNSQVIIDYKNSDGNHVFSVKDSGIGIASEDQAKIFGGFFRARTPKNSRSWEQDWDYSMPKKSLICIREKFGLNQAKIRERLFMFR
jgi:signal transduction histidine kinase